MEPAVDRKAGIPEVIDKKNKGKSILNYQPWWFPNFSSERTSARANFKRFDSVQHFSDHHYVSKGNASKQFLEFIHLPSSGLMIYKLTELLSEIPKMFCIRGLLTGSP
ncbi:hypothetical protein DY000_02059393 [Brassica cretica]|uniref:Uncharacterized protein n=1 Tax=Brassica cretica TaxID=69181 RepID=A0ABQ7B3R9_BRACR|nr:hypothetical protein DY000_02059393 [Brassica cretica]